ncbi:hypothetical protein D3C81_1603820 [compost metagenome]
MAVELDVVDRRVGLEEVEDHVQACPGIGIQVNTTARKADPRLAHLVIVHRQEFRRAGLIISVGLVELDRQHPHFHGPPGFTGSVAHHGAASIEQTVDKAAGLALGAGKKHTAAGHAHRAQVDIAPPGLPRRSRRQQSGGAGTQYIAA